MKTLLQINSVVNSGSTGRIAEEIGRTAIANGWQSYIAYGRNERPSKSKLIKIGNKWDVRMHGLQTRIFDNHGLASKNATKKFISTIERINPDIIHLHNLHGYYINYEILFSFLKSSNIPVIWTLHDCWPFTGHCAYFDFVGCNKWKSICYQCPLKKSYPTSYIFDRSKKNFSLKKELFISVKKITLVPVSNWLAILLKQSFLKDISIQVINNGINTSIFKPDLVPSIKKKFNLEDKFIIIGVASVWGQRKGFQDFIKLAQELDSSYQIILVGVDSPQLKLLPKNIIGIRKTESVTELAEVYSAGDVFVNPTYEDNFPTTNLESLACGTPVITYKTGGSPEAIDSTTGIVVEKGDFNGLVSAIREIKKNGKDYYYSACVKRAKELYNKEDRYQEYIDLYNKMLSTQN